MGVLFIDNARLLPDDPEYFNDCVHYTTKGIEKLAQNYSDFLVMNDVFVDYAK